MSENLYLPTKNVLQKNILWKKKNQVKLDKCKKKGKMIHDLA